jgi:hypothetical protein
LAGEKLGDAYANANMPVVRRRLYQAGARLATVLNGAFLDECSAGESAEADPKRRSPRLAALETDRRLSYMSETRQRASPTGHYRLVA